MVLYCKALLLRLLCMIENPHKLTGGSRVVELYENVSSTVSFAVAHIWSSRRRGSVVNCSRCGGGAVCCCCCVEFGDGDENAVRRNTPRPSAPATATTHLITRFSTRSTEVYNSATFVSSRFSNVAISPFSTAKSAFSRILSSARKSANALLLCYWVNTIQFIMRRKKICSTYYRLR